MESTGSTLPLKRAVVAAALWLLGAAAVQELRTPPEHRRGHGRVLGVPYDFRPPTPQRFRDAWFNPDDARLFPPREFGLGWAVNLPAVGRRLRRQRSGARGR